MQQYSLGKETIRWISPGYQCFPYKKYGRIFWKTTRPNLKAFANVLNPFPSSPSWAVDDKNRIQYINKVLVKETPALVFISIDLKAFLALLEVNSHGKTSAILVFSCGCQSVHARTQILSFCTMQRTSSIKLLFTFSSLPIASAFVFQMSQNL